MLVRYIGPKAKKEDNVAGTGVVWLGHGDIREVPAAAWAKLSAHPDVWERVDEDPSAALGAVSHGGAPQDEEQTGPKFVLSGPAGDVVLDDMPDAVIKQWVKDNLKPAGVTVDLRGKGDKLRQAVIDAVKAVNPGTPE